MQNRKIVLDFLSQAKEFQTPVGFHSNFSQSQKIDFPSGFTTLNKTLTFQNLSHTKLIQARLTDCFSHRKNVSLSST